MALTEHVAETESEGRKDGEEKIGQEEGEEEGGKVVAERDDLHQHHHDHPHHHRHHQDVAMLQRLNPTNPLRIVINGSSRLATHTPANTRPSHPPFRSSQTPRHHHQARATPTPQQSFVTLNSTNYTNKISLLLFMLHLVVALGLICFLIFKGVQGLIGPSGSMKRKEKRVLKYLLPQVEAASLLSIILAFIWQKSIQLRPAVMVHFTLWVTFTMSLAAGIVLICFQNPPTVVIGVLFIAFAIGNGLYACWVNRRIRFSCKILGKSLEPVSKFQDLNHPTYIMLGAGFLYMSLWILAVIGALNFYVPALIIIALVMSLAWVAEVMRNVVNITVGRVISLYYLRGMQCSALICLQRALTRNLGGSCLGSLFVPAIEALRIMARGLNLLEGEDEFMFSCAHCCLRVMESIFRYGNGWAFVQIAAYGKGFVQASQDTWALFERQEMEVIVDSDMTSSICFLSGVCSGSLCVIFVAAWTVKVHESFTATLSLLAFFIGYLMTRIAMVVPHACVSCYYVCYAENPNNRLFDTTIKERQDWIKSGRGASVPTPRVPRTFAGATP